MKHRYWSWKSPSDWIGANASGMRPKSPRTKRAIITTKSAGRKTITLYENHICPAMCPILHFLAIAFAHNAFHPRLVSAGLTPHTLHSFSSPDGRILTSPSGTTSLRSRSSAAPPGPSRVYTSILSRLYPPTQFHTRPNH